MSAALIAILLVFVGLMAGVLYVSLRGRRKATSTIPSADAEEVDDNRVAVMFFVAILVGAGLAIAAALLLFFLPK